MVDHISSACAKYYSDVALSDTHTQIAHPINTEGLIPGHLSKWERPEKEQSQEASETWPGEAGLKGDGETSVRCWAFIPQRT